ncbi:MAG: 50S ribosomal protein L18 [Nanoarchaeota archaeon]|nr:50S ribosomal protein L18 [Nanoarchaeota archaeon]
MSRTKYGKTRTVPYRRKREGRTNYKKRLTLLKSGSPRLVLRKSLNMITAQIIEYNPDGDRILVSATSKDLHKMGWKMHRGNIPSAYLTGLLLGVKAKKKKINNFVLDIGLQTPIRGGRLFAALKGLIDSGVEMNFSKEAFPSDARISGKHIAEYASKLSKDPQKYQKQFSGCIKQGVKPEDMCKHFEDTKKKVIAS